MDKAENIQEDVVNGLETRLSELETMVLSKAALIEKKMNEKAESLQAWEARLQLKQEEQQVLQGKIDVCAEKMKGIEEAEQRLKSYQQILAEREQKMLDSANQTEEAYKQRFAELEQAFREKGEKQAQQLEIYNKRIEELLQRENNITVSEQALEAELNKKRSETEAALLDSKRQEMEALSQWITKQQAKFSSSLESDYRQDEERRRESREQALRDISEALAKEREQKLAELAETLKKMEAEANAEIEARKNELAEQEKSLQARIEAATQHEQELRNEQRQVQREGRRLDTREAGLDEREDNLEEEVNNRFASQIEALKSELAAKDVVNKQLQGSLANLQLENQELRSIKEGFGDDPFPVMNRKINELEIANQKLRDKVQELPTLEDKDELLRVNNEVEKLRLERENLLRAYNSSKDDLLRAQKLQCDYDMAMVEKSRLERQVENAEQESQLLQEKLNRLMQSAAQASERQERIDSIEKALVDNVKAPLTALEKAATVISELEWLDKIGRNCYDYGFKFPQRILYAFHTALKISDWSTLTVLAGVSGTGKSELPHLYAAFGGLNFLAVPVQPNWDSQESMLGYFNSIDNKFDAQPLLRFLAQCSSERDGMDNSLNIVLLDEMNLAHVEHYFAEFLSKLELRRNTGRGDEPFVDINIGAGMDPYQLRLTRNVLWTGTMNQDETTKSLSDKVLDRGLVINFPRPKELISRKKLVNLDEFVAERNVQGLDSRVWAEQWVKTELPFSPEQEKYIDATYRVLLQKINDNLAEAGRALGHRVWQSIEFYIANYPLVDDELNRANGAVTVELKKAIRDAVEDQLVQKCMPKLRGIEVRSNNDCLQKIRTLLQDNGFNLDEDFQNACELGYGQFMWSSAEYINVDQKIAGAHEINDEISDDGEGEGLWKS